MGHTLYLTVFRGLSSSVGLISSNGVGEAVSAGVRGLFHWGVEGLLSLVKMSHQNLGFSVLALSRSSHTSPLHLSESHFFPSDTLTLM